MSRVKSTTAVCPECGTSNPESARFCANCAARLGAEPSIAAPRLSAPSQLAASGAIPSRPSPLPAPHANTAAFWVKLGIGGLIVMIGFIGWSVYVLTDVKVVTQVPTGQGGNAGATVSAPAAAPATPAAPSEAPLRPLAPSAVVAVPAAPVASAPSASPAPSAAVQPNPDPPTDAGDLQRRIEALEKQLAGQRTRAASRAAAARAAEESAGTVGAAGTAGTAGVSGWVEPSRSPAMTSAPGYRDAGPPVVAGPAPSVPAEVVRPAPAAVMPSTDGGPPVVEGPGPRYDFSRSGGANR